MIESIKLDDVASFKNESTILTRKRVNLVYGLNGTGKSTLSELLYRPDDSRFARCVIQPPECGRVFVYNGSFIQDNFFVSDMLQGIFTLSQENKSAEEKISRAEAKLADIEGKKRVLDEEQKKLQKAFEDYTVLARNKIWTIKEEFSGGDRILDYCLDGLKGNKEKLFQYISSLPLPESNPTRSIREVKKDVETLRKNTDKPAAELTPMVVPQFEEADVLLLAKPITGSSDSPVATLIEKWRNAHWVKQGLAFVDHDDHALPSHCPFCQERTLTKEFIEHLGEYFDDAYEKDVAAVRVLEKKILQALESYPPLASFTKHPMVGQRANSVADKHQACLEVLRSNLTAVTAKLSNPSQPQKLLDLELAKAEFNALVTETNRDTRDYNEKLENVGVALTELKSEFWNLMRHTYDQTLERYEEDVVEHENKMRTIRQRLQELKLRKGAANAEIVQAQKETVNTQSAVDSINTTLLDIGIDDFKIERVSENHYRIVRRESPAEFKTLSEGERMIISFLYFCELCRGRSADEATETERIVVIDDPVSSLSHVHVFNVGQLIKARFLEDTRFSQVFVLTHSLYFFYELTDRRHERRKDTQEMFRIIKGQNGSQIVQMEYQEIQNDYEAYWAVINDDSHPPALIANCMRNIIEYFFGFVRRRNLNEVFQLPELRTPRFQAFCRYVNRESHSDSQNIMDMKEFNHQVFLEGLRLIFEKTGYGDHFVEMRK